jgi:hypothetical protein
MLDVCANTTLCINLIQQIRTVRGAESQMSLILVLIAVIFSHVGVSYELFILTGDSKVSVEHSLEE